MTARDVNGERLFAKISGSKVFKSSFLKELYTSVTCACNSFNPHVRNALMPKRK